MNKNMQPVKHLVVHILHISLFSTLFCHMLNCFFFSLKIGVDFKHLLGNKKERNYCTKKECGPDHIKAE